MEATPTPSSVPFQAPRKNLRSVPFRSNGTERNGGTPFQRPFQIPFRSKVEFCVGVRGRYIKLENPQKEGSIPQVVCVLKENRTSPK